MLPVARDDGKTCLPVRSTKKKTPHGGACRLNPDILRPAVLAVRKLSLVVIHASCALSVVGKTTQARSEERRVGKERETRTVECDQETEVTNRLCHRME